MRRFRWSATEFQPPLATEIASNRVVKTAMNIHSTWSFAGIAVAGLLQAGVVYAQVASNPPSSAIVAPKTEKTAEIVIEPKKLL